MLTVRTRLRRPPVPASSLRDAAVFGQLDGVARLLDDSAGSACFQALRHAPRHAGRRWQEPDQAHALLTHLVAATGTPDPRDSDGFTPLLRAAEAGDLLTVQAWLQIGADPTSTAHGRTALHLLARAASSVPSFLRFVLLDTVQLLVTAGCDPDTVAPDGLDFDGVVQAFQGGTHLRAVFAAARDARVLDAALPTTQESSSRLRL